jgi:hypothetical protein
MSDVPLKPQLDRTPGNGRQADWSAVGSPCHVVQFYQSDGHLLDLLARFVGTALVTGDVALVIATRLHREGLAKRLKANGLDLNVPREQGRFIPLDAEATLAKITSEGRIDEALFREIVGGALDRAVRSGERRRIVAFGELVALLWARGKAESAIKLEQYWNNLALDYEFGLCCAYPMGGFGHLDAASFMKICALHSHVFTVAQASPVSAAPR